MRFLFNPIIQLMWLVITPPAVPSELAGGRGSGNVGVSASAGILIMSHG